ncbi:hypothetical protein [Gordonia rubripertincta]|uniref:ESX-1 secretion-associated protein n=1 Tax=Gordonia rubripertincta TaxID=36822 RepID=A0ABT4N1U1_GORRU|nr:hypothetical protein [Gordonia rubripertincta]MCZ4553221.1 hypothetical protein [Gordonia rubripertincta]
MTTSAAKYRAFGTEIEELDASSATNGVAGALAGSKTAAVAARSGEAVDTALNAVAIRLSSYADSTDKSREAFDGAEDLASRAFSGLWR